LARRSASTMPALNLVSSAAKKRRSRSLWLRGSLLVQKFDGVAHQEIKMVKL
jgi:hypothetical protein